MAYDEEDCKQQLFIPDKICVGKQKREGTYSGLLAYVIYYDKKGVRRKEKSWESWRDKKIKPIDFDNTPMEGFVLNKGVGGQRQSYGWNARNEYIRVYDPRDFEFEISVSNLLFILRECDCSKGKGLEGKFCYAWDGTELVLLPEISEDYQNSKKYTDLQGCSVKAKDLICGASYTTKKQEVLTYLGRFDYHYIPEYRYYYYSDKQKDVKNNCKKQHVFWDGKNFVFKNNCKKQHVFWDGKNFVFMSDLKAIAVVNSETVVENYAELVDKYNKSENGSPVVRLFTKQFSSSKDREHWVVENADGTYTEFYTNYEYTSGWPRKKTERILSIQRTNTVSLKDGVLKIERCYATAFNSRSKSSWERNEMDWVEPTNLRLYAELANGSKFRIINGAFLSKENRDG